jgi:hypothetical protein
MNGLGALHKSPNSVFVGVARLQLSVADLAAQTRKIAAMVGTARRNRATMDLVAFPKPSCRYVDKLSQATE